MLSLHLTGLRLSLGRVCLLFFVAYLKLQIAVLSKCFLQRTDYSFSSIHEFGATP